MKKILLVGIAIMLMAGLSLAQEEKSAVRSFISSLPDIRTGFAWDLTKGEDGERANDLLAITTVDIIKWGKGHISPTEDKITLGAGIITQVDNTNNIDPCVALSWHIGGLENLGFSYPLSKLVDIEIGAFAGRDFDKDDWKAGLQATILRF